MYFSLKYCVRFTSPPLSLTPSPFFGLVSRYPLIMCHSTSRTSYLTPHTSSASLPLSRASPYLCHTWSPVTLTRSVSSYLHAFRIRPLAKQETSLPLSTTGRMRMDKELVQHEHRAREKLRYEDSNTIHTLVQSHDRTRCTHVHVRRN